MALRPQDRERGLVVLNEARQTRRRAIVFGRVRVREVATGFWLMTFSGLVIFSLAYYRYSEVQLASRRGDVLAQQRAVATALGTAGFSLRDKLEAWAVELAEGKLPNQVASGVSLEAISGGPGIYLRLRQPDALDSERIRKAARRSLHDGFTSCLFVGREGDPKQGLACKATSQCGPGELCNGWSVCAVPGQPYNLRLLYEGLRLVEPQWGQDLEATRDELQVRAIELDLQDAAKHEVVAAAELVRRSKYFTVVLDELPSEGEVSANAPALGLEESPEEQLQATDHFVRVGIWDIERAVPLLALRLEAAGRFVAVGQRTATGSNIVRAQQRQANNCAVATEVREVLVSGQLSGDARGEAGASPPGLVAGE